MKVKPFLSSGSSEDMQVVRTGDEQEEDAPLEDAPLEGGAVQQQQEEAMSLMTRTIRSSWGRYHGVPLAGVDWGRHGHGCEAMRQVACALGGRVVHAVCLRLAKDYELWGHGLPDLVMMRGGVAKMVEVKGPGDSLSAAQSAWIDVLLDAGADVEVCHVTRPPL